MTNAAIDSKTKLTLRDGQVHLWQVDLDATPVAAPDELSVDELKRGAGFRFAYHRNSFYARRIALRRILSLYLGRNASDLIFDYNPWGKPRLSSPDRQHPIEFSASSVRNVALVVVTANRCVGVDIEIEDADFDRLSVASQCFTARETEALRRLDGPDLKAGFYRLWTGNEALGKAIGRGLMQPEDRQDSNLLSFLFETELSCAIRTGSSATHWTLQRLSLETPGFHAAICVEGNEAVEVAWQSSSLLFEQPTMFAR